MRDWVQWPMMREEARNGAFLLGAALALAFLLAMVIPVQALPAFEDAGVTATSRLYKFDIFFENVHLRAVKSPAARAELRQSYIRERISEIEVLAKDGRAEEIRRTGKIRRDLEFDQSIDITRVASVSEASAIAKAEGQHKELLKAKNDEVDAKKDLSEEARTKVKAELGDSFVRSEINELGAKEAVKRNDAELKEWLREQAKLYGFDFNIVSIYEDLTGSGKVNEAQRNKAEAWWNGGNRTLPGGLADKVICVRVLKDGQETYVGCAMTRDGRINRVDGITPMDVMLTVRSGDIPLYVEHTMANDKVAMGRDAAAIGAAELLKGVL